MKSHTQSIPDDVEVEHSTRQLHCACVNCVAYSVNYTVAMD